MDQSYLYTNISSTCLHSGFVTSFFEISRGARQVDLLSSLLYTMVAKVLRAAIRNCKDIRAVSISAPGLVSISGWTALSVRVSWRL